MEAGMGSVFSSRRTGLGRTAVLAALAAVFISIQARADITVGGNRPVKVFVPPSYDPTAPTPLIVFLHGYGGSGSQMDGSFQWKPIAEREGFIYAVPDGLVNFCGFQFWNATDACCGQNVCPGPDVDDSAYLIGVVQEIQSKLNVDPRRIHFAGWSNGGFMSYRMACDHADVVAAIASFAGATFSDPGLCRPASPVHVLQAHGTADAVIAYAGSVLYGAAFPGGEASVRQWAAYDGCSVESEEGEPLDLFTSLAGDETGVTRFADACEDGGSAELWTIKGGAHDVFPGSPAFSEAVVRFLLSHPKLPVPEASLETAPASGAVPLLATADASRSSSRAGTQVTAYRFDFGEGTPVEGAEPSASHLYETPGRFPVALTIRTDDEGRIARATGSVSAFCPSGEIAPWKAADIGAPLFQGSARLEETAGEGSFLICGGGAALGVGAADECHFVHQEVKGDFRLTAPVADLTAGKAGVEVGLMFRESLAPGSRFAAIVLAVQSLGPTPGARFIFRSRPFLARPGATVAALEGWLRLERRGNLFSGSSSVDGKEWSLVFEKELALPGTVLGGIVAVGRDSLPASPRFEPVRARITLLAEPLAPQGLYRRGDSNADGSHDLSDAVFVLGNLFLGDPGVLDCRKSADFNDDGSIDISDAVSILSYLFLGVPERPADPFPSCGLDPTPDELDCLSPPNC